MGGCRSYTSTVLGQRDELSLQEELASASASGGGYRGMLKEDGGCKVRQLNVTGKPVVHQFILDWSRNTVDARWTCCR